MYCVPKMDVKVKGQGKSIESVLGIGTTSLVKIMMTNDDNLFYKRKVRLTP